MRLLLVFTSMAVLLQGCLTFKTVEYQIKVNPDKSASGTVIFRGIGSDVLDPAQRELDLEGLVNYCLQSEQFLIDHQLEGRKISNRQIYIKDGLLSASLDFTVGHIGQIEGHYIDRNILYIDVPNDVTLNFTNGDVIPFGGGKQVNWVLPMDSIIYSVSIYSSENWSPFSLKEEFLKTYPHLANEKK